MIFHICKFLTKVIFSLFYRLKIFGVKKNFLQGSAIIASNHNSFLDPIALQLSIFGCLHHLARSTLFNNNFTAWLWKQWACHPIHRGGGNSAAFKIACKLLDEGKKLVIYPEGSRSPDGQLQEGKIGIGMIVMKAHVPVIPAYIGGSYDALNRNMKFPKIWRTITTVFGTPLYFDDLFNNETLSNKDAYKIATNRIMEKITELKAWYEAGCHGEVP
ncbi:lysophospholipid acyltransferase family protein [Chlamydia sp. 17-3921]|uniref:lysophospholipid acyltransferase family protein n=1 Tax=Chlamydia sp. 17-3921 TaxID=2675798 RepID=UPI0019190579|nr:lysophospholipid acyltransferase family protein [Chlamydia sp. 17-3921]